MSVFFTQGNEARLSEQGLPRQIWTLQRSQVLPDQEPLVLEGRYFSVIFNFFYMILVFSCCRHVRIYRAHCFFSVCLFIIVIIIDLYATVRS